MTPEEIAVELDDCADSELALIYNSDLRAAASLIRSQAARIEKLERALLSIRSCPKTTCGTCNAIIRAALERT